MSDAAIAALAFLIALSVGALLMYLFSWLHGQSHPKPPLEERIESVLRAIRKEPAHLQEMLDEAERRNSEKNVTWVRPTLEYFRRLDSLASSPSTTSQDLIDFAKEASEFERKARLHGPFAAFYAHALARLMRERDGK